VVSGVVMFYSPRMIGFVFLRTFALPLGGRDARLAHLREGA
jgi:hypothetical protein